MNVTRRRFLLANEARNQVEAGRASMERLQRKR